MVLTICDTGPHAWRIPRDSPVRQAARPAEEMETIHPARDTVCPHIPQDDAQCCIHHLLSSQSATSVNNTNNSSTCVMNAVTAAVNPCNASKESVSNVDWCFGQNPSDRSVWLFPVSNTQSRFLLAVPRGDGLRWSSGGTLRSCEEPEPHWAIAGAQQPSTCCPQPT